MELEVHGETIEIGEPKVDKKLNKLRDVRQHLNIVNVYMTICSKDISSSNRNFFIRLIPSVSY